MKNKVFFFQDLMAMPTLETDNRKIHAESWLLKVSTGKWRIWIQQSGAMQAFKYMDGDFKFFQPGKREHGTGTIEIIGFE